MDGPLLGYVDETILEVKESGSQEGGTPKGKHQWESVGTLGPEGAGVAPEIYGRHLLQ